MNSSGLLRFTVVLLALTGLPLFFGGVSLAALGGSLYYIFSGVALLASGALIASRRAQGVWIYGAFLIATIFWSIWEVGLDLWLLMPRLFVPLVLAIVVVLAIPQLEPRESCRRVRTRLPYATARALGLILIGLIVLAFVPQRIVVGSIARHAPIDSVASADVDWRHYGRSAAGTRFSPAGQITTDNVHQLEVAWIYRMGDPQHQSGEHQVTPLQVGHSLYLCTDRNEVIALDAESGKQQWRFDPRVTSTTYQRCRGVGYHEMREPPTAPDQACQRRVITSTIDVRLIALDAETGKPCAEFGTHGVVDLTRGMGEVQRDYYSQTSAPLVARDLIIVGGFVHDSLDLNMPSGVVRAFRATSGELVWAWDPGNPAVTGLPLEGTTYTRGSPNMWSAPSFDDSLGLIYVPLGVATGATDFWGGWRNKEIEMYSNSVVALDVTTGRPRWHFQAVHHDLWDYDLPPQPTLFDVPDGKGGTIPALIQGSKQGQIFLLDRRNGKPIAPIIEKPVPQGGQPDDWTSPTQPYSVGMPAIGTEVLTEARMWGATPFDQLWCRIQFRRLRYEGEFTPPTLAKPALLYPSAFGGMNWGGLTVDESRDILLVNDIRLAMRFELKSRADYNQLLKENLSTTAFARRWPSVLLPPEAPYGQTAGIFLSPLGIPCNAPPWGTLTAIDLASRKIVWQMPLGTARDTGPLSLKLGLPLPIGLPTLGGSVASGSGLVFFAGTRDFYLRAIDVNTGSELWKGRLPVGAQATPMTYISSRSGRQFIVIVAGGTPLSQVKGDYVIAYALGKHK
jgi:quinate dehydrogenase (quinone)